MSPPDYHPSECKWCQASSIRPVHTKGNWFCRRCNRFQKLDYCKNCGQAIDKEV